MSEQIRLLMVDDDTELCELIGDYLEHEGFEMEFAHDADEAQHKLQRAERYQLMILDVMMPGRSGMDLLQEIRPRLQLPVIMLTGRGEDIDRILGLEMGADDYLSKPCNPRELVARIKAVLRRSGPKEHQTLFPDQPIAEAGIELDPGVREVTVGGHALELTGTEFNVLAYLMNSAGSVISKEQLTELVLHRKLTAYDRAIDVHVSRVRQKLGKRLAECEVIKTVRGVGYQFIRGA
ncbi:response regulator transcription factor [Pontibacterium granulatum]|uniref:response regulator transcription factor n=1 Tax=Pontibacterium granulatum TaxID=2036029 RepID=UPI00249A5C24|nr:response regulator transcription factor [Pontibacterium granulatum]MDI3324570.1 response regulator transcription factor [Pontibacterium granulatum]